MTQAMEMNEKQFDTLMQTLAQRFQPVIETKTKAALAAMKPNEPVSRKQILFGNSVSGANNAKVSFLKAILDGDRMAVKALSEGTSSAGGYLVPAGFREEIVMRLPEESELAPYVRVVPVHTDSGNIPSLATDISVTWTSASGENTSFTESDPVLGTVAWALKRADAITKISRELAADATPSIMEFISQLFREAIARERDKMIAIGDGSTQPTGLANTSGITTLSSFGVPTFSKLVEMEQNLKRKYRRHARWIMNGTNLRRIFSLLADNGEPLFRREMIGDVPVSRILGYPVSQQDDLDDSEIYFGDLSFYLLFDREEMGIESTTTGGDAFVNHQIFIKVFERIDGKVGLTDAFVKASDVADADA